MACGLAQDYALTALGAKEFLCTVCTFVGSLRHRGFASEEIAAELLRAGDVR
jgi:hypothetical protein